VSPCIPQSIESGLESININAKPIGYHDVCKYLVKPEITGCYPNENRNKTQIRYTPGYDIQSWIKFLQISSKFGVMLYDLSGFNRHRALAVQTRLMPSC